MNRLAPRAPTVLARAAAVAIATAASLAVATPASAQSLDDRYWLHVAGFRPQIDSVLWSDVPATGGSGTRVRFEDELGLAERATLPWFQAGMRLGERWRIELEYFSLRRSGTRAAARDIVWEDTVFPVSASLTSRLDSDVLRLSGGYSLYTDEVTDLGAVLGLHVTRFRVSLEAQAALAGFVDTARAEAEEALVPLPTIGLYARREFGRGWAISGRVDYFSLKFDEYDGGLVNAMAEVDYHLTDHVAIAVGYRYVDYTLEVAKPNWRGGIEYRFSGPFATLKIGF